MFVIIENYKKFLGIRLSQDIIKIVILAICFFIIMGVHSLIKEIKDAVFMIIVGKNFIPDVKTLSFIAMIPLVFMYSWIASRVKRHWILIIYACIYGIGGLIFSYLLNDEVIGLKNSVSSPFRFFGWIFYLFFEGHYPFIVGVLWTYLNSVSNPKDIKTSYMVMTIATKLGGIFFTCIAWLVSSKYINFGLNGSDVSSYIFILTSSSIFTLIIPFLIFYLSKNISYKNLSGYADKNEIDSNGNNNLESNNSDDSNKSNNGSGFMLLFKHAYIFGIFGMIFFWEIVNVIFNYMRLGLSLDGAKDLSSITSFLYKDAMLMHLVGLFIVCLGTSSAIRFFGQKFSLLLVPLSIGGAISIFLLSKSYLVFMPIYMFMRAFHYAFEKPLNESLYIATSHDVQFKTKSWIDSFGAKLSKGFGSLYNKILQFVPINLIDFFQTSFFFTIIGGWIILAYYLGREWEKAIKKNKVIG
jgi:AAA family ATP:ADP antiporter